jgi:subtilisin family serine protease
VSVAAVDVNNAIASFSNTGRGLDLAAPGVLVLSSVSTGFGSEASVSAGASTHRAFGLEFAGKTAGITDTLVSCGTAAAAGDCVGEPADGSWIALIQRGGNSFAAKVENAMAAGADAAIIYNNAAGDFVGTLGTETTSGGGAWIPAVSVSDTAGAALIGQVGSNATVVNMASSWDHFDGTSMATPHVSGIAALVFGANPALTPTQVESILKSTAQDLGKAGYDTTFGYGIPQAEAAVLAAP